MSSLTAPNTITAPSGTWEKLLGRLTEPSSEITDLTARRQARLQLRLLLTFMLAGMVAVLLVPVINSNNPEVMIGSALSLLLLIVPYGFSRTRYYRIGTVMLLALASAAIAYPALTGVETFERVIPLHYLTLVVVLATLLLEKRHVFIVIGLLFAGMFSMYIADSTMWTTTSPLIFLLAGSALLIVFLNHRDALERDRQGELVGALERAESAVEAELRLNDELESRNQQLARANLLIKESTRLKSEFLATMSHELRTPLNAIRGFTGIMLEGMGGEVDDEARHMLSRVDANSERLLGLINDVLDIAKIEAGRMELLSEPFNPYELTRQWQSQMSVLAEKNGITFDVSVDDTLPQVIVGDAPRLTQIAINLLSNAFKFTKEGTIALNIRRDEDHWTISVKDTGMGIPPHALNYIFEEFRQVDGSSKREHGGTGLGLAITRTLCRMMGGTINVRSELGKGSEFIVTLPLSRPEADETQPFEAPA